jgi:hypothetical protein
MDEELKKRLDEQDKRLEAIYRSTEKMRKAFLWTLWITIAIVVLPILGLVFVIPAFLRSLPDLSSFGSF